MTNYDRATQLIRELEQAREKLIDEDDRNGMPRRAGAHLDRLVTIASLCSTLAIADALKGAHHG